MKKILFLTFPACVLIALGLWYFDCVSGPSGSLFGDMPGLLLAFGRLAGLAAAAGILAQLILVSRAGWLEPLFGLDRLTKAHHIFGLSIPFAFVLHPVLVTMHYAGKKGISFWGEFSTMLAREDVPAAAAGALLLAGAVTLSLPSVRRRLSYETWHFSHLFLYAGLGLALGHQFELGGDISGNPVFARTWYALYAFSISNLVWGRVLRPLLLFRRHMFTVEKIVPETTETESIWITGRDISSFPAQAGQFALLRFWAPGFRAQAHPFSISMDPGGSCLRFTVKKLGDFTATLHHSLRPGVPVIIAGPYGVFTESKCLGDKALLIAGGIGITPLRALAERFQASGKDCIILYSNRAQKDVVFRRELAELEGAGGLRVFHVLSEDPDWTGEKGFLDAGMIKRLAPDFLERDAFLCGPPPMIASVSSALTGLGMSATRIHSEVFSL